jgi:hypothetical protein
LEQADYILEEIIGEKPMAIYGSKVAFFSYEEPKTLTIIDDSKLATAKRKQFEHFWKLSKK